MNDYFVKNDFTKGFSELFSVQTEFVKQATEHNKKLALEVLKGYKAVADAYTTAVEDSIRKLNGNA